jgi:hypothetical protein
VIVNTEGDIEAAVQAARDIYTHIEPLFTGAEMYVWMEESGVSPPSALKRLVVLHRPRHCSGYRHKHCMSVLIECLVKVY